MERERIEQSENCLYRKIDNTLYEISIKQSEEASESLEDILLRLISADPSINVTEDTDGKETRKHNGTV